MAEKSKKELQEECSKKLADLLNEYGMRLKPLPIQIALVPKEDEE